MDIIQFQNKNPIKDESMNTTWGCIEYPLNLGYVLRPFALKLPKTFHLYLHYLNLPKACLRFYELPFSMSLALLIGLLSDDVAFTKDMLLCIVSLFPNI